MFEKIPFEKKLHFISNKEHAELMAILDFNQVRTEVVNRNYGPVKYAELSEKVLSDGTSYYGEAYAEKYQKLLNIFSEIGANALKDMTKNSEFNIMDILKEIIGEDINSEDVSVQFFNLDINDENDEDDNV